MIFDGEVGRTRFIGKEHRNGGLEQNHPQAWTPVCRQRASPRRFSAVMVWTLTFCKHLNLNEFRSESPGRNVPRRWQAMDWLPEEDVSEGA